MAIDGSVEHGQTSVNSQFPGIANLGHQTCLRISVLIWIQTVLLSNSVSERTFLKSAEEPICMKNYPACKLFACSYFFMLLLSAAF